MLYEKYEQKITKISAMFSWMKCHKALLLTIAVIFFGSLISIFSVKGIIYSVGEVPAQITYGENATFKASAIMGKVNYEYALKGTENWSSIQPRRVGSYKVRAVSKRIFGSPNYSEAKGYEILPKTINVIIPKDTLQYGDSPQLSAELMFQDKISCSSFDYVELPGGKSQVSARIDSIVITDENGENVSNSYIISTATKEVLFTNRIITISVASKSAVYSGKPISSNEYAFSSGSLASGDNMTAKFNKQLTEVGEVENTTQLEIKNQSGEIVTNRYSINIVPGKLIVTRRPLNIYTESAEHIYDGQAFSNAKFTLNESETPLAEGQNLEYLSSSSITSVGTCSNEFNLKVTAYGTDVTKNYSFNFPNKSKLTVTHRTITLKTFSAEKQYDGSALKHTDHSIESDMKLVAGHNLNLIFNGAQIRAGESSNTVSAAKVFEGSKEVTENYKFEYNFGTLKVTQRPITVTTETKEFTYNGKAQFEGDVLTDNLVASQSTRIKENTIATLTNVSGAIENSLAIEIFDMAGDNVTDCYNINYIFGNISMKPLPITVTTATHTFTYNGEWQSDGTFANTNVAEGQTPKLSSKVELKKLKDVEKLPDGRYKEYENIFSIEIFSGETNVTSNYDITYIYGMLKMVETPITVTTETQEFVYNGEVQSNTEFTITVGALAAGENASQVGEFKTLKNVERNPDGSLVVYKNEFIVKIVDGDNNDVTSNYYITYIYGNLTMKPRPITITTDSQTWEYDGKEHSNENFSITEGSLVNGNTANILDGTLPKIIDAGSKPNNFSLDIHDGLDLNTYNYDITYKYGTLTITAIKITITTHDKEWKYDGNEHSWLQYTLHSNLLLGHEIDLLNSTVTTVKNVKRLPNNEVGFHQNTIDFNIRDTFTNKLVTGNYSITYIYGTLKIIPREIAVATDSGEWTYNGEEQSKNSFTVSGEQLVSGQYALSIQYETIINVVRLAGGKVGTIDNIIFVGIIDGAGNSTTVNYNITYKYGTLKMNPRNIIIVAGDAMKGYDGTPLRSVKVGSVSNLVDGHTVKITTTKESAQTEIGSCDNVIETFSVFSDKEIEVTKNYDAEFANGTLTVTLKEIKIKAGDASKVYDKTPLTCSDFEIVDGGLLDGHKVTAKTIGSQTEIGFSDNSIDIDSVTITANGVDVSKYYLIIAMKGILIVYAGEITLTTGTAQKEYDGTPLTFDNHEIIGELFKGHTAQVTVTGTITEVGAKENTADIIIYDSNGEVVYDSKNVGIMSQYIVNFKFGILTITAKPGGDDGGGGGGGGGSSDGSIDREPGNGGKPTKTIVFKANSDTDGTVYFRDISFGNYNLNGWDKASAYQSGDINPLQLMNFALEKSGKKTSRISIEPVVKNLAYLLPYYATSGYHTLDDTQIKYNFNNATYYTSYIPYNYSAADTLSLKGTEYETFEKKYNAYVLKNYLQLPTSTRDTLLEIAAKNNLKSTSASIITDVAKFVQNKVAYSLDFQEYIGDIATFFFTTAKTGICQHYATAATAMFRALGIPARYTTGYSGDMSAGQSVEVTSNQAHAWVEVYIAGAGWVEVEVTGAGGGGGGGGGGIPDEDKPVKLNIKPKDVNKVVDGTPLFAINEIEGNDLNTNIILESLKTKGYRYTSAVEGQRTIVGISDSVIKEFVLYDDLGRNVSDKYKINYFTGQVRITNLPIYVNLIELKKTYDGKPLFYKANDYWVENLPNGCTLTLDLSEKGLTDSGSLKLSDFLDLTFTVYKDGVNVTELYSLVFQGEPMKIFQRPIEVHSASTTKAYDGLPLTDDFTWLSKGSLVEGNTYEAVVSGSIIDIGKADNTIESIVIKDKDGVDVTANYGIKLMVGTLIVIDR